jgi:hypothetical protein
MLRQFTLLLCLAALLCGESRLYKLPVTVNVEGSYIRTDLRMGIEMELFEESFETFRKRPLDAKGQAFASLVESIRANRPADLARVFLAKPKTPSPVSNPSSVKLASPAAIMERSDAPNAVVGMYRNVFNDFADLIVIGRVSLGDHDLYLWQTPAGKMKQFRGFLVVDEGFGPRVAEMSMEFPVETFLLNSLANLNERSLASFAHTADAATVNLLRLNLGKTSAFLEFTGQALTLDAYSGELQTEPLRTYGDAWTAFRKKDFPKFLSSMSPASRERLSKFLATVGAEGVEAFYLKASGPRFVRFVIQADPLFLVFVAPTDANQWPPGALQFDYVFRNGSRFELVNATLRTFLDDILRGNYELEGLIRDLQPTQTGKSKVGW